MTENSENLHMSFFYHIDWHIFFPEGFENFHANWDTLVQVHLKYQSFPEQCVMVSVETKTKARDEPSIK